MVAGGLLTRGGRGHESLLLLLLRGGRKGQRAGPGTPLMSLEETFAVERGTQKVFTTEDKKGEKGRCMLAYWPFTGSTEGGKTS